MNLLYVHTTKLGYGRYGVKLAEALEYEGVELIDSLDPLSDVRPSDLDPTADPANVVCWVSVPSHALGWFKGQMPMISTMWESGTLPESFRESLSNFHQVIVPSDHNVELFSRYHGNVKKVTLGIDPLEWHYTPRQPPGSAFRFLIGGSGSRKGLDLAFAAFRKLWGKPGSWGDGPIPYLVFKSPRGVDYFGERIEHLAGFVSDEQEREIYESAHCYLQPSRGEGFGLQPLQAIAQGVPTILTDAHGQHEFAHLGYGISATRSKSGYFIHGDAGEWWEPSLDELCEYMHYVYYNYAEACSFAKMASEIATEQYTWQNCAKQFIETVGVDLLCAPYSGDGSWYKPEFRKYPVRTTRWWPCSIAGQDYQFKPGETYYVPADVKRILFEQGVLHPNCVTTSMGEITEEEVGLMPDQLERLPEYSVARMHCQACGQRLGSSERWQPEWDEQGNLIV
jgi:hypothetical protein